MTWPRWLESVSSRVAAPTTSTVSVRLPGRQLQIDALAGADRDLDVVRERGREALQLRGDLVAADRGRS